MKNFWFDYTDVKFEKKLSIALWMGCTTALRRPELAARVYDVIYVFENVTIFKNELCCGIPSFYAGDVEGYLKSLQRIIAMIQDKKIKVIVSPCPSCVRALRELPKIFNISLPFKVFHVVEYLWDILSKRNFDLKTNRRIVATYYDPCGLGRHLGVFKEPRLIISSINNVELVEMKKSLNESRCCGSRGLYLGLIQIELLT